MKFEVYDWRANLGSGDPGWLHGATQIPHPVGTAPLTADWSDTNLPWAYANSSEWRSLLPVGVPVVNLSATGATFWDRLNNTVNAQPGRFICRLPAGDHVLTSFRLIGSSGDPTYSFGFWFPKLAGFDGEGPDRTFVTMAANSMTTAQINALSAMTQASFSPNQMGLCRFDSSASQPGFVGGVTFRAANQNPLTSISGDITNGVVVPQSAPHQGPVFYYGGKMTVAHVRFQGAGKAWMSQPPFEMANCTSATSNITWRNCEFDGRLSPAFDAAQPRKCGPWMANDEILSDMYDSWMHHSNVSRYAANDEGQSTTGRNYKLTRCKLEQITNTKNDGNGGYTNATPFGWESTNATITVTDCIIAQNNPFTNGQIASIFQLTSVGGFDPVGGRMNVIGGVFRNTGFPTLNGWVCFRIPNSHFKTDGYATTVDVRDIAGGARKTAYIYSGTWPPTQAQLTAAGVAPATHYLVRES